MISAHAGSTIGALGTHDGYSIARDGAQPPTAGSRMLTFANGPLRSFLFLSAVVAINYTMTRPSPVDFLFFLTLLLCFLPGQKITINGVIFFVLLLSWIFSVFVSSISLSDDPTVVFTLVALTHVILISLATCLVVIEWNEKNFHRFINVYLLATCTAAALGVVGFALMHPDLTWDDRSKGFMDDPNMYSAFLIPGILSCLYMLSLRRKTFVYACALGLLLTGIVVGFSRAAMGSLALWGTIWLIFLNRRNLVKATIYAALLPVIILAAGLFAYFFMDEFGAKLAQRFTFAMEYDRGQGGRYNRYLLSISYILDHPLGMGLFEIDKYFPEPIHNIWLSSFMNYGWLAGFAWTLLVILSVRITIVNFQMTRNPLCILMWISWMAIFSCALLHQAERWRHFWMFAGLLWGFNWQNFQPVAPHLENPNRQRD
jgi:hypothetical protein